MLGTLEWVLRRADDVDAFVFACFSAHAAIDATRELTRKPALGIAEAAMAVASLVGHRFSIVTTSPRWKPLLEDAVRSTATRRGVPRSARRGWRCWTSMRCRASR